MSGQSENDGCGCGAILAFSLVVGAVVAAVISIAALVDPFSWMPAVGEIWADCEEDFDTPGDDCDLASRFPGFWSHAIVNFVYLVVTVGLLVLLAAAVLDLRQARAQRFSGAAEVERYRLARRALAVAAGLVGVLAALPIVVALG
jgi:hypothetical protein